MVGNYSPGPHVGDTETDIIFAWYPVMTKSGLVWLKKVKRTKEVVIDEDSILSRFFSFMGLSSLTKTKVTYESIT